MPFLMSNYLIILGFCALSLRLISSFDLSKTTFEVWRKVYQKKYNSPEDEQGHYTAWLKNYEFIRKINQLGHWNASMNKFADISPEKFKSQYLMRNPISLATSADNVQRLKFKFKNKIEPTSPTSFDWRDHNAVTSVKDQGAAGTCWAFSTVGNIEGQWAISNKQLIDLSPEYLVDCDGSHDEKHADCSVFGGWPYLAYGFVIQSGGIPSESTWPYCSGSGGCYPCMEGPVSLCGPPPYYCDRNITLQCASPSFTAKITSWSDVSQNEDEIMDVLYNIGPLSVLLDASQLQFYSGGIWDGHIASSPAILGCSKTYLDHAVLLVGYGVEGDVPYWTVKNSWGLNWGEQGYFRIVRGQTACGINTAVTTSKV